jgi:molybdopterin/thiamine biosynthesis adenylyltransferase
MIDHVDLIGIGGTGSFLVRPLSRLIPPSNITLYDGDVIENKNLSRQSLSRRRGFKTSCFKSLGVKNRNIWVRYTNYLDILNSREGTTLVLACVDRFKSRSDILWAIKDSGKRVIYISPGNDLVNGQVICWDSNEINECPLNKYEVLSNPPDTTPGGCFDKHDSTPQLISTNYHAASLCISLVKSLINKEELPERVDFNVVTGTSYEFH